MKFQRILISSVLLAGISAGASAFDEVKDTSGLASPTAYTPAELLRGQVSGVRVSQTNGTPSSLVNVNVRGVNSFRQDNSPLWIVDGVEISGAQYDKFGSMREFTDFSSLAALDNLAFINAYDIENIQVLKNASATALYGSKGANGVVIIRTHSKADKSFTCNIRSNVSLNQNTSKAGSLSLSHNHYLNLNGSTESAGYYLSGYYKDQNGVLDGCRGRYYGARLGFDSSANKYVNFGLNAQFSAGNVSSNISNTDMGYSSGGSGFDNSANETRAISSAFLNIRLGKLFTWKNNVGIDFSSIKRYIWYGSDTVTGLVNGGVSVIPQTCLFSENFTSSFEFNRFISKHHLEASLAFVQNLRNSRYNVLQGSNFFTEVLRAKGLSLSAAENLPLNHHNLSVSQLGAAAAFSYDYDSIIGLDASYRADFTPRYSGSKPVQYPAAQLYFNAGRLFGSGCILSTLRVEGGWGASGRDDYSSFNGEISVEKDSEPYYETASRLYSREWNAGIKFGFLSDRLLFGVTCFTKDTEDCFDVYCFGEKNFGKRKLWKYSSRTLADAWKSTLNNKGVEFDAEASIIRTSDWNWAVKANFALNANKVVEVSDRDRLGGSIGENVVVNYSASGSPVYSFYGYDENGNAGIIGNPVPKYYGGLTTVLSFRKLTVEAVFDGAAGFDLYDFESMVQGQTEPYTVLNKYVHSGDFLRLGRLSAGYQFKHIGVSLSATNLFTFTAYKGYNPDVNSFGAFSATQGIDCSCYPAVRSFLLGVNIKF